MKLTLGPLLFNWSPEIWTDFYARIADEADVDCVVVGEVVCSKRLPFYIDRIPDAIERLQRGGKQVMLASPGLITLERERRLTASFVTSFDLPLEVNDFTALAYLPPGRAFALGPLVNVYNEGTLAFLAARGGRQACLPPELPLPSIARLAAAAVPLGVGIETWAFGRVPLALSARCYHARVHGLSKDSCQFVCGEDRDGLTVDTQDGRHFLAINGIQTLSHSVASAMSDIDDLTAAAVSSLRLSPQDCDMVAVAAAFRARIDGAIDDAAAQALLQALVPWATFSNGFIAGQAGAQWVAPGG